MFVVFGLLRHAVGVSAGRAPGHRARALPHLRGAAGRGLALPLAVPLPARGDDLRRLGGLARRGLAASRHPAADGRRCRAGQDIFNVTFVMVLVVARRAGLDDPPDGAAARPDHPADDRAGREGGARAARHRATTSSSSITSCADSPVARGERIPRWARPSLVVRKGQSMRPQSAGRIEADDHVYLFTAPRNIRLLDRLFASPARVEEDDKDFFGEFYIDTSHTLGRAGAGLRRRAARRSGDADRRLSCWSASAARPRSATACRSAISS